MQSWWTGGMKTPQPKPNLINTSSNLLSALAKWNPTSRCLLDQQMMVQALPSQILQKSRVIQPWPSLSLLGSVAMSAPPHRGVLTSVICIMDHTTWICWSDASLFCCVQNHWVCTETVVRSFCVNALAINTAVWVLTFIRVFKMEGNLSGRASTKQLNCVNPCLYFPILGADFPARLLLITTNTNCWQQNPACAHAEGQTDQQDADC